MRPMRNAAFAAAFLGLAAGPASAQTAAPAAPATQAPRTDLDAKPGTLSDKLSDTNGVIKPTGNVDPDMHKAAPQTGTMPVIKPGTVAPGTAK
ncbi:hypothetical protein [Lichenibacterium dinghuense]|uniref:hypothetical protein n=1 Tax=Lichenibacterium dinghuense TaxID=2895977 RepID=UPI001F42E3E9|nr:hypothetical protein [Lichenibacterium sp. 6Y81]